MYLERKDEKQRQSWRADQEALAALFAERLSHQLAGVGITLVEPSPFTIRPQVTRIEPGSFMNPTEVNMRVYISDATGNILDEIALSRMVPFDMLTAPASGQRIRTAAKMLGYDYGTYLRRLTRK
jgi:hypothetical protein